MCALQPSLDILPTGGTNSGVIESLQQCMPSCCSLRKLKEVQVRVIIVKRFFLGKTNSVPRHMSVLTSNVPLENQVIRAMSV